MQMTASGLTCLPWFTARSARVRFRIGTFAGRTWHVCGEGAHDEAYLRGSCVGRLTAGRGLGVVEFTQRIQTNLEARYSVRLRTRQTRWRNAEYRRAHRGKMAGPLTHSALERPVVDRPTPGGVVAARQYGAGAVAPSPLCTPPRSDHPRERTASFPQQRRPGCYRASLLLG